MSNIINYTKLYLLGGDPDSLPKTDTKEQVVDKILSYPAIAVKGDRDELIAYSPEIDPTAFHWSAGAKELLMQSDEGYLRILRNLIEKRIEAANRQY